MPAGTCAICVAPIADVTRREPLGRNDGLVPVCDSCAQEPIVEVNGSRGRVFSGLLDSRAHRIRAHRQGLFARGICVNGENHGAIARGRLCLACSDRQRKKDRDRQRGVRTA